MLLMGKVKKYIADFDSTTSVLSAVSNFLNNRNSPVGGKLRNVPDFILSIVNSLPESTRRGLYKWSGWYDAFPPDELKNVNASEITEWVIDKYPKGAFPAVFIGSANGAAAHLAAAMRAPYLPQTFLLPVRRSLHPDDLTGDLEWGKKYVPYLLENNTSLRVYQMHDPIQDRLMVQKMAYLRIKLTSLQNLYRYFIQNNLGFGGIIFICTCTLTWKVRKVSDRHFFQPGGFGAATEKDLIEGSPALNNFLKEQGADKSNWKIPEVDTEVPEAEWGFDEEIMSDLEKLAQRYNFKLICLTFNTPDDMSPFTAELYKWWYTKRNIKFNKMLIECFSLLEPKIVIDSRMVPYWLAFNTRNSTETLKDYCADDQSVPEKYIMIMNNGIRSIDISMPQHYHEALIQSSSKLNFLGLDESKYPVDLKSYGVYDKHLREIPSSKEQPEPLTVSELLSFYEENKTNFNLKIVY